MENTINIDKTIDYLKELHDEDVKAAEEAKVGQIQGLVSDLSDYATTIDNSVKRLPEVFAGDVAIGSIAILNAHVGDINNNIGDLPGQVSALYGVIEAVYKEEHPITTPKQKNPGESGGESNGENDYNGPPKGFDEPLKVTIH